MRAVVVSNGLKMKLRKHVCVFLVSELVLYKTDQMMYIAGDVQLVK